MNLLRVFVAVDITDEGIKKVIEGVQKELLMHNVDMKPVELENLHITLRFIGEVPQATVNEIIKRLKTINYKIFKIHVKGLGVFPDISNPRVIWAGIEEGAKELIELHEIVEKLIGQFSIRDEKEFRPHLTIGRLRSSKGKNIVQEVVRKYQDLEFGYQIVDSIKLKRSILTPRGPIYSDLLVVKLQS